jgi:hypothetical protein
VADRGVAAGGESAVRPAPTERHTTARAVRPVNRPTYVTPRSMPGPHTRDPGCRPPVLCSRPRRQARLRWPGRLSARDLPLPAGAGDIQDDHDDGAGNAHLAAKGVTVSRKKYRAGQVRPMFCDLWVGGRHALIEAKNSDAREALRMAIGQLYDYRRFHELPVCLAVLLPYKPNPDGLALLQSAGIEAIWPHGAGFRDSAHDSFI